jgi:LysM repeat protein
MDAQGSNDFLYSISRRFIQSPEQIRRFFFLIGVFLVVILLVFGGRSQP